MVKSYYRKEMRAMKSSKVELIQQKHNNLRKNNNKE